MTTKLVRVSSLCLAAAVVALLNGCGGDATINTPEGRVSVRADERTGAISVLTPKGSFRGSINPGGGGSTLNAPGARVRVGAGPRGANVDIRTPEGNVRVRAHEFAQAVDVLAPGARVKVRTDPSGGLFDLASREANVRVAAKHAPRYHGPVPSAPLLPLPKPATPGPGLPLIKGMQLPPSFDDFAP